jgi:hypothetical protein
MPNILKSTDPEIKYADLHKTKWAISLLIKIFTADIVKLPFSWAHRQMAELSAAERCM